MDVKSDWGSEAYYRHIYGDWEKLFDTNLEQFAKDDHFVTAKDFQTNFQYGQCFQGKEAEAQVQTVQGKYVPYTYEEKMSYAMLEFSENTTAHGIPQIRRSTKVFKVYWTLLSLFCLGMFLYQAVDVVEKYQRNEKIVDIELRFETAPFPAVTVCNLNPYKTSAASNVKLVQRTLSAFDNAMEAAQDDKPEEEDKRKKRSPVQSVLPFINNPLKFTSENITWSTSQEKIAQVDYSQTLQLTTATTTQEPLEPSAMLSKRRKRSMENAMFEPALSHCDCTKKDDIDNCPAKKEEEPPDLEKPTCLCAFDRASEDAWPCHEYSTWEEKECDTCNNHGYCPKKLPAGEKGHKSACFCNTAGVGFCVAYPKGSTVLKLWEYYGSGFPTEDPLFLEAMGFAGMTDEVAIVTKAKENVMFAMSSLSPATRKQMSYRKEELIHKCSFNGAACDIENDFRTHLDPVFGACYTFNWDVTGNLTSNRAGPMYGLRILVYVNTTEYMPTTEAAGVRMTVHEKSSFPFPDSFGYSAPTGFISSFGIRLRSVQRLPAPYGNCVPRTQLDDYIYDGYDYSTEGCFRSCFQQLVLRSCKCGDPRFPVLRGYKHCEAADPVARRCLADVTSKLGGLHGTFRCDCQQPCAQSTFDVTYSASKWPSKSLKVQLGSCTGTTEECVEHYQEHGAMLEVFYEQLNFETLSESQAYGWVNLLADFGGQLGLWLGVSVLTCFEFIMLVWRLIFLTVIHQYEEYKKRKAEKERLKNTF